MRSLLGTTVLMAAVFAWGCSEDGGRQDPAGPGDESSPADEVAAAFADSALTAAVGSALGRPTEGISEGDLASLTHLSARDGGIADLRGIEQLVNLNILDLADNQIQDLSPLSELTKLSFLDLGSNRIADIAPLAALDRLEALVLENNAVTDLSPLLGLSRLTSLAISLNPLTAGAANDHLKALQARGVDVEFQVPEPDAPAPADDIDHGSEPRSGIVFLRSQAGSRALCLMDEKGGSQTVLIADSEYKNEPSWSPDGLRIVFVAYRDSRFYIDLINADLSPAGYDGGAIFTLYDHHLSLGSPSWSPDGASIAFTSRPYGNTDVFVMEYRPNAVGGNPVHLTSDPATDICPSWSPDGSRFAFCSDREGDFEIYVANSAYSEPVNLSRHEGDDLVPVWSPDGSRIAFLTERDGNREVYVMAADGANPVNLTNHPAGDTSPSWSPDGSRIAFATERDGNWEIYVMEADGTNPVNITNHPADDRSPAWSPN